MVRTTREEFESLEESAWWMHEACMELADLRAYFGGEKELALARMAADQADAVEAQPSKPSKVAKGAAATAGAATDVMEVVKEQIKKLSVKELKFYLDRHKVDHSGCVEKRDLLANALEAASMVPPEPPKGPAWMLIGAICRLCAKPVTKEHGGVHCRRQRVDGSVGGCGESVCWRCMKRAPRESFGSVRTTQEEFASLEDDAWWMHEGCLEDGDYKDYFGDDGAVDGGEEVQDNEAEEEEDEEADNA